MVGILALISAFKDLSRVFFRHRRFLLNVFQAFRQIVVVITIILRCVPSTLRKEICWRMDFSHWQMGSHLVLRSLDKGCIWPIVKAHVKIIDSLLGSLSLLKVDCSHIEIIFVSFVKLAYCRLIILYKVAILFNTDKDVVPEPILAVLHLSKLHLSTNLAL